MLTARIVILNYNGRELLEKCLPSIAEAAARALHPTTVTVLDNQSTDDSAAYIEKEWPNVTFYRAPANRFLCSFNEYLPKIQDDITILLNNDLRVAPDFVDPLVRQFEMDNQTFLSAPLVMNFEGTEIEAARARSGMRFGLFWCNARYPGYQAEAQTPSETDNSGFGAFSRQKFLSLGGYDDRYLPGIMEDVDLCLRAKRSGYRCYYVPESKVFHMGQATFKKAFGAKGLSTMAHRNSFLFMWKNFSGLSFWLPHLFFLPLRIVFAGIRGDWTLLKGLFEAMHKARS